MKVNKITYFWIGFLISAVVSAWLYWIWRQKRVITPEPLVISRRESYQPQPKKPAIKAEKPDDLLAINGVGPVTARRLNEAGILTYRQLADTPPEKIVDITGTKRWDPEDWISEANDLSGK